MNSKLFRMFAMLIVFSMIVTPVFAQVPVPPTTGQATAGEKFQAVSPDEVVNLGDPATYIVLFEGSSLVAAAGGAAGLDARAPIARPISPPWPWRGEHPRPGPGNPWPQT